MPPSSSGSGHLSFKEAAGIRLPLGVGVLRKEVDHEFSIKTEMYSSCSWVDARAVNGDGL